MKALALFSGGLDSSLAIKVMQNQGIEVIALNFVSYFFGGKNEKAEKMAETLGVKLEYIDFKDAHMEIVKSPPNGYGKNMNPCIDCHAMMMKVAGKLLEKYGASFVITGEVLGQRPMSQNPRALRQVEKLSEIEGLIVRPLSGKILPETIPEKEGWIKREEMLNISGRSRVVQMSVAEEFGIKEYPTPGGGCLLTDPGYSKRLKILKEDGKIDDKDLLILIKLGRFYRIDSGKYLVVARDAEHNKRLPEYFGKAQFYLSSGRSAGPTILGLGDFSDEEKQTVKELYANYSKTKGDSTTFFRFNGVEEEIDKIDHEKIDEFMKLYQIL